MEQALATRRPDAGAVTSSRGLRVVLLGRFEVGGSEAPLALAPGSQRLLAYVALAGGAVRRDLVAGVLWPQVSERAAQGWRQHDR
jgi:DNA-binding SARP family transcriptional activator